MDIYRILEKSWSIIISVFLLYITGSFSSPVDTVSGFIGDSVILPCSISESELQGAAVLWRDDQGNKVFDTFVNITAEDQAKEYKNRVETFPDEQKKGNVSIKLIDLQKTDEERTFICFITSKQYQNETHIKVHLEERPVGRGNRGGHGELTSIVSLFISFSSLYLCV